MMKIVKLYRRKKKWIAITILKNEINFSSKTREDVSCAINEKRSPAVIIITFELKILNPVRYSRTWLNEIAMVILKFDELASLPAICLIALILYPLRLEKINGYVR